MKNFSSPKPDTTTNGKPPGTKRSHCQNKNLLRSEPFKALAKNEPSSPSFEPSVKFVVPTVSLSNRELRTENRELGTEN